MLTILGTNIPDTTCHQITVQFSPHPMYASALPKEIRSIEICVEINRKPGKSIPDIMDRNLKKDQHILIIFGSNISNTTGY